MCALRVTSNTRVALRKESVDRNGYAGDCATAEAASLSARRAWIEILKSRRCVKRFQSLSARRAWIEMGVMRQNPGKHYVALRKESVDRNVGFAFWKLPAMSVALRKESVDRNDRRFRAVQHSQMSLSARRAWIEI